MAKSEYLHGLSGNEGCWGIKGLSGVHYLKATRWFTLMWAIIIIPAILFSRTEGSILEVLSKVGSYFVGAKLAMYGMGFFSKHTTERGLLVGVAVGFVVDLMSQSGFDVLPPSPGEDVHPPGPSHG